ncbi:MAG TPA: hypothetical protein VMP13_05140 [Acidimicrobiia bacterium]|nr:hypothetical protein [Acidimicrobiia bacterium]
MFLFVGLLIGFNLTVRVGVGEVRVLQEKGHARGAGQSSVTPVDAIKIGLKAAPFLIVPMIIGQLLDLAFGSSVTQLFD